MNSFLADPAAAAESGIIGIQIDASDASVLESGNAMNAILGTPDTPASTAPDYSAITRNAGSGTGSDSNFSPGVGPVRPGTANSNSAAIGVVNRATPGTNQAVPPGTFNPGVNQEHIIPEYPQ